jgi:hypothetical protein
MMYRDRERVVDLLHMWEVIGSRAVDRIRLES